MTTFPQFPRLLKDAVMGIDLVNFMPRRIVFYIPRMLTPSLIICNIIIHQAFRQHSRARRKTRMQEPAEPQVIPREGARRLNTMRFQVQWGTHRGGPAFSQVAVAPGETGVTTAQAIAARNATVSSVTPNAARRAAEPAVVRQHAWILSRPPAGIAIGGYSHSEYFRYRNFTDARVDVENLRGHNLRG